MHFTSIASIAPLNSCQLAEQRGALGLNQGKELKCISIALKLNRITFHITDVKIIASKKMSPHDKLNIRNYRNVTGVHFTLNFKFIVIEFEYIWLQLNFVFAFDTWIWMAIERVRTVLDTGRVESHVITFDCIGITFRITKLHLAIRSNWYFSTFFFFCTFP